MQLFKHFGLCLKKNKNKKKIAKIKPKHKHVYVRGTGGQCSCVQQPDTHSSLLQNMGGGRFVCYTFLLCAVLNFLGGSLFGAQWTSRNQEFKTRGRETFLYLKTFTNSVVGFCSNMRFLRIKTFHERLITRI